MSVELCLLGASATSADWLPVGGTSTFKPAFENIPIECGRGDI